MAPPLKKRSSIGISVASSEPLVVSEWITPARAPNAIEDWRNHRWKPLLDGLIVNHARCEWLWSKRTIVADAHRASDKFDVATKAARRDVDGVTDKKATWVDVRALTEIECVRESNGVHLILALSQEELRPDFRISDLHMPNGEDVSDASSYFVILRLSSESSTHFKFCVAIVIETSGRNAFAVKTKSVSKKNGSSYKISPR